MKIDKNKDVYWYRIHPGNSTNYFQTFVWPTHKRFIKALHASRDTTGMFIAPKKGSFKNTRCIGDVHLCTPHLHPDVIMHEWIHAALYYAKHRNKMDFGGRNTRWGRMSSSDEEDVCDNASRLSEVCIAQLKSRGFKITSSRAVKRMYGD